MVVKQLRQVAGAIPLLPLKHLLAVAKKPPSLKHRLANVKRLLLKRHPVVAKQLP